MIGFPYYIENLAKRSGENIYYNPEQDKLVINPGNNCIIHGRLAMSKEYFERNIDNLYQNRPLPTHVTCHKPILPMEPLSEDQCNMLGLSYNPHLDVMMMDPTKININSSQERPWCKTHESGSRCIVGGNWYPYKDELMRIPGIEQVGSELHMAVRYKARMPAGIERR